LTFFFKPTISLWSFFFSFYFPDALFIPFLILFHISFISSIPCNGVFCTCAVTSLMNSSFTSFLFSLPILYLYCTFLSFLTFVNFQSNFSPYKKVVWVYFSTSHTSHITNIHALSSVYQYIIYLDYLLLSGDCQVPYEYPYVDAMFPSQLILFPMQHLLFIFHYHLFRCEGCALHMLDKKPNSFSYFSVEVP